MNVLSSLMNRYSKWLHPYMYTTLPSRIGIELLSGA